TRAHPGRRILSALLWPGIAGERAERGAELRRAMAKGGETRKRGARMEASLAVAKERDLYSWAARQAALLREGRVAEIDAAAIAEEIDDVGEEQYHRLESALRALMHDLLKWDYQPAARSRSRAIAIREQKRRADRQL